MADDCTCMDRRSFLRLGGMTLVISAVNPSLKAFADSRLGRLRRQAASGKTLVYVFQRFGADGLNIVVPTEGAPGTTGEYGIYRSYRSTLALDYAADLQAQQISPEFCLHPSLRAGLHALWQQGRVAVLPNVGYPDSSRSHFDSQMFLDNGTPWDKTTRDGWLNRYLQSAPGVPGETLRAVAFSSNMPFSLVGSASALSFSNLSALAVSPDPMRDQKFLDIQRQVYALPTPGREYDPELAETGVALVDAINAIRATSLPAPTVTYPNGTFGSNLSQLAQLIRSGAFQIEIAEVDLGGWDTHTQQGALAGTFPNLLAQLSDGIKAFVDDLDNTDPTLMQNTLLLTASEFGRTARENGNQGTDHGNAWATFAVGGPVRGGIYGSWISLSDLRDNRDIKHSVDFRDVFSEALSRHLGTLSPSIFPGWSYTPIGYL